MAQTREVEKLVLKYKLGVGVKRKNDLKIKHSMKQVNAEPQIPSTTTHSNKDLDSVVDSVCHKHLAILVHSDSAGSIELSLASAAFAPLEHKHPVACAQLAHTVTTSLTNKHSSSRGQCNANRVTELAIRSSLASTQCPQEGAVGSKDRHAVVMVLGHKHLVSCWRDLNILWCAELSLPSSKRSPFSQKNSTTAEHLHPVIALVCSIQLALVRTEANSNGTLELAVPSTIFSKAVEKVARKGEDRDAVVAALRHKHLG